MRIAIFAAALALAMPASAQPAGAPQTVAEWLVWVPSPGDVALPPLAFAEDRRAIADYDKYFYFSRVGTDFATALQDIRECDLRARGLWQAELVYGLPVERAVDPSDTMFAQIASPLLAGVVAALAAPADARRERRFSLRRCMFFKGYARFGLSEGVFLGFNYEATDEDLSEEQRQRMLAQQALVAVTAVPQGQELGL